MVALADEACDDFNTTLLLDLTDCDSDETFVEMLDLDEDTGC